MLASTFLFFSQLLFSCRFVRFLFQTGTSSRNSQCRYSYYSANAVQLQYSTNAGFSWNTIRVLCRNTQCRTIFQNFAIPQGAKTPHTRFRWIQPYTRGTGYSQWAIDDVVITSRQNLSTALYSEGSAEEFFPVINGGVSSSGYCGQAPAILFSTAYGTSGQRYAITKDLNLSGGSAATSVIQFDLVMGCGVSYGTSTSYNVVLQYSTNLGASWTYVQPKCTIQYARCVKNPASSFEWKMFKKWRRVTMRLPSAALTSSVRFRWMQSSFTSSTTWAIKNIVIDGTKCSTGCSNRGRCMLNTTCLCDAGFSGSACMPSTPAPRMLHDSFDSSPISSTNWLLAAGATIGTGCLTLAEGSSLYFNQANLRMAITRDLNLVNAT